MKAIMLEEERARRRKARTLHHPTDPVSASRSPNAKVEPPYKTRYATHSFACKLIRVSIVIDAKKND